MRYNLRKMNRQEIDDLWSVLNGLQSRIDTLEKGIFVQCKIPKKS